MADTYPVPRRFFSLDVLRGGLTFFIILFHWQHFFYDGGVVSPDFIATAQPLFWVLRPLYTQGIYAVDFFFSLSGFIFYWLYGEAIASKKVSGAKYTAFRVSRLYPLHIATLILVIIGQQISVAQTGGYTVYQENDWYHLVLNLFFVNAWGFETDFSFNGPAWTVSIEALMYIAFFIIAYFGQAKSLLVAISIAALGFYIEEHYNQMIGMGLHSFFIGGIVYIVYSRLQKYDLKRVLFVLTPICAIVWSLAIFDMYLGFVPTLKEIAPGFIASKAVSTLNSSVFATMFVIPLSILFLALVETVRGTLGKRAHVLGDMSYALYLLHFPLQMAFIFVINAMGIDRSFFYTVASLVGFYAVLFPLSYCSYFYFELPCQKYLRRRLTKK